MRAASRGLLFVLIMACSVVLGIIIYIFIISMPVYHATKQEHSYTSGLYRSDNKLGYALYPNAHGHFVWSYGDSVPVDTDEHAFRIAENITPTAKAKKKALFLGDSFTFGEQLLADSTFPNLIGDKLSLTVENASVSGYGYVQMVQLAERYIEELDPDVVFVQVSPWLAQRAVDPYMPAPYFKVPVPYWDKNGNTVDPYFQNPVLQMSQTTLLDPFRTSEVSMVDRASFVWNFTFPIYIKELCERFKLVFTDHDTMKDPDKATEKMLTELMELTKDRKLVFLVMGYGQEHMGKFESDNMEQLTSAAENLVIDLDSTFYALPDVSDKVSFEQKFNFWHGNPPELVDYHYNASAHQLITRTVVTEWNTARVDFSVEQ